MPSPYKELPITFEKGLVTEISESLLDIGQSAALVNWEPLPNGALQARNRWGSISTLGLPVNYKVRGWGTIAAEANPRVVQSFAWPNVDSPTDTTPLTQKALTLSNITEGSILVAVVHADATISCDITEDGWTPLANDTDQTVHQFWKVADGTETTVTAVQTAGGTIDTLRPASTTRSAGVSVSGAATHHEALSDLSDASDISDNIDVWEGKFSAGTDPGLNTGHVFKARTSANTGTGSMTHELWQGNPSAGGSLIVSLNSDEGAGAHWEDYTLTTGEASLITDYTDLYGLIDFNWGGPSPGNGSYIELALELPGGGTSNIVALTVLELGGVELAAAETDTDVTNTTLSLSRVPGQAAGIAVLSYSASDFAAATPNAKSTPAGWTRYNVSYNSGDWRAYDFAKLYTSAAAITDTWNYGGNSIPAGGVLSTWDIELNGTIAFYIVLAVATDTGYSLYRILRDDILTGTWELIDSDTASSNQAFVSMSQGAGELIWSAVGMDQPRQVTLSTLVTADVANLTAVNGAGRVVQYHKDRMFVAGSSANPGRMYFSDIGNPDSFTVATDYLDIGGDDGEAIEDLVSVEGLLLVCKTNRLYLVSGSGIESFFVNELAGGTAATGRPAIRTPYGTIVVGPADIWVVQGGGVDPMSRPLGEDFVLTGQVSTAYAQDSVLVLDNGTNNLWRVNLVTGAWSNESVVAGENLPHHLFSLQSRLYYGVGDSATEVGGTRRLSSERSYDEITGATNFIASTGRVALLGPSVKYTPRWLFVQSRNRDMTYPNALFVDIETDHGMTTKSITVTSDTQRDRVDIPKDHTGSEWIKITFRSGSSAIAGAIDPERVVLGVDVEAPR